MIFKFHDVCDFIIDNRERHHAAALKNGMADSDLNVDYDYFFAMSQLGRCIVYMIEKSYAVYTFNENPLHKHIMEANNEIFYVSGRKGFLKDSIDEMKRLGAHKVNFLVKNPKMGRYLRKFGLSKTHELWSA